MGCCSFALRGLVAAAFGVLTTACAASRPLPHGDPAAVLEAGRRHGVSLSDPLALPPDVLAEVREKVGGREDPLVRIHRLDDFLRDGGAGPFAYAYDEHLDAEQAYRQRRGDCLAYAMLFASLARSLDVPVHFLHARSVGLRFERGGSFFTSSHVAVAYGTGPAGTIIDFTDGRITRTRSSAMDAASNPTTRLLEPISDAAIVALHYSNVAVTRMVQGRLDEAGRMFEALIDAEPDVAELYNNYGVLLNRQGRHREALDWLERGLTAFPSYPPLYTNGVQAARAAGKTARATEIEARGRAVAEHDPSFVFARGMYLYERKSYAYAAAQFERAHGAQPDSPLILAWLTRAYARAGDRQRAREAFAETRRLAPHGTDVRELAMQFPDLAQ
ncbi:MAG: tetratricopeptide repeat protein [Polyangiaceae bacterium]